MSTLLLSEDLIRALFHSHRIRVDEVEVLSVQKALERLDPGSSEGAIMEKA